MIEFVCGRKIRDASGAALRRQIARRRGSNFHKEIVEPPPIDIWHTAAWWRVAHLRPLKDALEIQRGSISDGAAHVSARDRIVIVSLLQIHRLALFTEPGEHWHDTSQDFIFEAIGI